MLYLRWDDIIFIMENGKSLYYYFPFFQDCKIGEHFMKYISDSIGEDYKNWKEQHTIFISSPTGSGKTAFILNVLLSHLAGMGKEVLYLVNRSILLNQIKNEINNLAYTSRKAITVMLYQDIENNYFKYDGSLNEDYYKKFLKYDCVICDEAHYFLMDSNYNTRTILSFNFIRNKFMYKLRIYMSATIDDIKEFIKEDNVSNRYFRTQWLGIENKINNNNPNESYSDRSHILAIQKELTYTNSSEYQVRNYDYIDIEVIKQKSEISKLVLDGNEKWIIFVDTKEFGKSLKKDIIRNIRDRGIVSSKDAVAFITSDYELDPDSSIEVDTIVSKNKTLTKVLIATSVLDNGINIIDMELRNVIIIADTETEFIQMLGRKRRDGKRLKLYIFKHNKQHFEQRRRINIKRRKIAEDVYNDIEKEIQKYIDQYSVQNQEGQSTCSINEEELNIYESNLVTNWHRNLLNRMMCNEVSFENIKCSFYACNGCLVLNPLSFRNFENLNQFYTQLISEFESYGENAFLRKQLQWLGKAHKEIEEIISNAYENLNNRTRERILKELQEVVDKELTKEDFIEFKLKIKSDLITIIESVDEDHPDRQKFINSVKKNERNMSKPFFVFLKKNCEIPFIWEKTGKNYVVKRIMD